jgi:hypothetical protein
MSLNWRIVLLNPLYNGLRLSLSKEEEGGAGRTNDGFKVKGCGWV